MKIIVHILLAALLTVALLVSCDIDGPALDHGVAYQEGRDSAGAQPGSSLAIDCADVNDAAFEVFIDTAGAQVDGYDRGVHYNTEDMQAITNVLSQVGERLKKEDGYLTRRELAMLTSIGLTRPHPKFVNWPAGSDLRVTKHVGWMYAPYKTKSMEPIVVFMGDYLLVFAAQSDGEDGRSYYGTQQHARFAQGRGANDRFYVHRVMYTPQAEASLRPEQLKDLLAGEMDVVRREEQAVTVAIMAEASRIVPFVDGWQDIANATLFKHLDDGFYQTDPNASAIVGLGKLGLDALCVGNFPAKVRWAACPLTRLSRALLTNASRTRRYAAR